MVQQIVGQSVLKLSLEKAVMTDMKSVKSVKTIWKPVVWFIKNCQFGF